MATKKQIFCPQCKAKLKFDPDKIISEVVKFKCPGCGAILRIRKPESQEASPSAPGANQFEPKTEATIPRPAAEHPGTEHNAIRQDSDEDRQEAATEKIEPAVEPSLSAKADNVISASHPKPPAKEHGPLIPEDNRKIPESPGESLLEDYHSDKLQEFEEGEADAGDFEWTQYAEKKGPKRPDSKIDLNVIPASAPGLQETLADLQQAETYNLQGEAYLEKNLVKQAIRDFNHALEINPNYVDALVNRGSAYVLENRYNEALNDFNHALDLEKKQAEIYNIRGEIYLVNTMHDEAIKDFTAAIILNPMYSDAYLNRAKAYNEKGMKEEAESDFNQAIKADSGKFPDIVDLAGSESLFDEEISSTSEQIAKYLQQGLEDLKNGKHYEAVESFTQVINLAPNDAAAYINRGQAYVELDQPDEAMVDLNRAALYDPLNPALYYWRAMAWKALNSPINMVADLKISCELGYEPACIEYENHKPRRH